MAQLPAVNDPDALIAESLAFFELIFSHEDVVLIRPVATWTENQRKHSKVDFKGTRHLMVNVTEGASTSDTTREFFRAIARRAEREMTNTFFGVCPRFGGKGQFDRAWQIRKVRVLWADVDQATVEEACQRVEKAGLPKASITVSSGHGVHLYWVLQEPLLIDDCGPPPAIEHEWIELHGRKRRIEFFLDGDGERVNLHDPVTSKAIQRNEQPLSPRALEVQDALQGIATKIGGDHTFDLSRLLRVPGTFNRKDQKNGREPSLCRMVEQTGTKYSFDHFRQFAESSPGRAKRLQVAAVSLPARKRMSSKRVDRLSDLITACRVAPVSERSEVDYRLCCWCVEHGLTATEILPQVSSIGKFAERGEDYFDRTWKKAEDQVRAKILAKAERAMGTQRSSTERESDTAAGDRIEIMLTTREHAINDQVIDALRADDDLFQRDNELVRVLAGGPADKAIDRPENAPRISPLSLATVREIISRNVSFYVEIETEDGVATAERHVPEWCSRAVHARGEWLGIRYLRGIVNHPVIRPDGSILLQPGYDFQTQLCLFWPWEPIVIGPEPSHANAIAAVARISHLVADFPFETPAHHSAWLAFLLTPLARFAFPHTITCPFFLIDANVAGSGKSKLADLVGLINCGFELPRMILPREDDELRKSMLAIARAGDELVLLDNVTGELGGQTLDATMTGTRFKGRILGQSRDVEVSLNTTFCATSNNASIVGDLCRRTIPIRLASPLERPEERDDFQIPNLLQHVRTHRPALLADALTILRAFHVAGRPQIPLPSMGSFEEWSDFVRQAVVWCGLQDPWETRIEFTQRSDTAAQTLGEILKYWKLANSSARGMTAQEAILAIQADPQMHAGLHSAICDLCSCKPNELPTNKTLGKRLASLRDRVFHGERLVGKPNRDGTTVWRVEKAMPIDVRGLRTVAGFPIAVTREELVLGPVQDTYSPKSHGEQLPETPQNPANPAAGVYLRNGADADHPRLVRADAPELPPWLNRPNSVAVAERPP